MTERSVSPKSRAAALALAVAVPLVGLHRFYVGKIGTGILMLCTAGGVGVWWIYDVITLASGGFADRDGRRVLRWTESDPDDPTLGAPTNQKQEVILAELDTLRSELAELHERMDFMERMLTQMKHRPPLSTRRE